ncbi:MAG: hypothetical protein ACLROI_11520 [Beduini sp.]|uniref:hypothetical protein n=1 Tax=Beduini sp. TaxID=1922300 RepID=UPI0011CB1373
MIETLFAFSLFSFVAVGLIQGIVSIKKGMSESIGSYQEKIDVIENGLEQLFLPVDDVEWAITQVLP